MYLQISGHHPILYLWENLCTYGSYYDSFADLTYIKDFFPSYHRTRPLVSISGPLNLEYMTTYLRVFCSALPTKKNEDNILWMNKIEGERENSRKKKVFSTLSNCRELVPPTAKICWSLPCTFGKARLILFNSPVDVETHSFRCGYHHGPSPNWWTLRPKRE